MRRRSRGAGIDFEDWCHWTFAQADDLDPVRKNLAKLSIESKQQK
jgi:hypothetical protein